MATEGFTYDAWQTDYETTDLNSLAADSNVLGAEIDNSTNNRPFIEISVSLATVDLSSQDNPAIYIWILTTNDTGYEDGGASEDPARPPDLILPVREANDSFILNGRCLAQEKFKILIGNRCDAAALAASGNTLDYRLFARTIS